MNKVLIGTSGFSYEDWVGPVYPPGTPKRDFLKLYAAEFPLVELNFSYYRQPEPRTIERMLANTPEDFRFSIKAHQSLTHSIDEDLAENTGKFKEGIRPLVEASRLGAVLCQFPYSFHYTPDSRKHLAAVCESLGGLPLAVEFRNREWRRESVLQGLRSYGAAFVNVDEPRLPKLLPPSDTVTSSLGYIRFHGRNRNNWWGGNSTSRYDYLYSREELQEWVGLIQSIARQVKLLLVCFNNHARGQAVQNARELKQILIAGLQ